MHRRLCSVLLAAPLAGLLLDPTPRDLDVGIPPGPPTSWGRRLPVITPGGGRLFPITPSGRRVAGTSGNAKRKGTVEATARTVAKPRTAKMEVRTSTSFGVVRILTWDLTAHLPWTKGDLPVSRRRPVTGSYSGEAMLPVPGDTLHWATLAAFLRLLLHPQLVPETGLAVHLLEVGETALAVTGTAKAERALAQSWRKIEELLTAKRTRPRSQPVTAP